MTIMGRHHGLTDAQVKVLINVGAQEQITASEDVLSSALDAQAEPSNNSAQRPAEDRLPAPRYSS